MSVKTVEVHIVNDTGVRRGRLPAIVGEDLVVQTVPYSYFTTIEIGHWFDLKIGGTWRLCEVTHTYDRGRTGDTVLYAKYVRE